MKKGEGSLAVQMCLSEDAETAGCIGLRQRKLSLALKWLLQGVSSMHCSGSSPLGLSTIDDVQSGMHILCQMQALRDTTSSEG